MNFYIASKLENDEAVRDLAHTLRQRGHKQTYDWTTHGPVYGSGLRVVRDVSIAEVNGVKSADAVIVLWPGGRGTHVEMGIAIGCGIPVYFVSDVSAHHQSSPDTCAFYHHPLVRRFTHLTDLLLHF